MELRDILMTAGLCLSVPALAAEAPAAAPADNAACQADPAWVTHPGIPDEVNGGKAASHCNIHQYAWASFIALMQPTGPGGSAALEGWMPYYGMFQRGQEPPVPWGTLPEITSAECSNLDQLGPVGRHRLHTIAKPFSDLTGQAGSLKSLLDQNGKTVYYEMRINHPLYDFFDQCDLYRAGCVKPGVRPSDLFFPNQAIEIKLSWKELTPAELASRRFYTSRVVIQENPDTRQCRIADMGMVGLHLTAATTSHPEMLWATFEQVDNGPLCAERQSAVPPNGQNWSFYDRERCGADCQVNTYLGSDTPAQVCLEYAAGSTAAQTPNRAAVDSLNASVQALADLPALLRNYTLIGTIYTQGGEVPPYQFLQTGSTMLSNTTMETYTQQGVVAGVNGNVSCFSCHTYGTNGSPTDMSHLVNGRVSPDSGGCSDGQLPLACLARYRPQSGVQTSAKE